ncbi:hypothetical protein [Candidatus Amarobacter glycogenicus]|uniref:hypothetical protein n=1 Tax=Candidatus Amarobacter glycogenicus TaxID=3140699 RepID=UPI002A0AA997|nr:hypothetical protein [Dehalococcoidia bacterium]
MASPILRAIYASTAHADLLDGNWGDHPLPLDEIVAYASLASMKRVGISLLTATINGAGVITALEGPAAALCRSSGVVIIRPLHRMNR